MIRLLFTLVLLPTGAIAQSNLDFEAGAEGRAPAGWYLAQDSRIDGYFVELRKQGCHAGTGCALIVAGPQVKSTGAGTLAQAFDATAYREKTMRLRAWVRLDGGRRGERIRVLFAVDGEKKSAEHIQKGGVREGE